MQRQRQLISQHTRTAIMKRIAIEKPWRGTREGFRIEVKYRKQLLLSVGNYGEPLSNLIDWKVTKPSLAGDWESHQGIAATVWDAIEQIHRIAFEITQRQDKQAQ